MRTVIVLAVSDPEHPYSDVPPHVDVTFSDGTVGRFLTEKFDGADPIIPAVGQILSIHDPGPAIRVYA